MNTQERGTYSLVRAVKRPWTGWKKGPQRPETERCRRQILWLCKHRQQRGHGWGVPGGPVALPCLMLLGLKWQRTQNTEEALRGEPQCGKAAALSESQWECCVLTWEFYRWPQASGQNHSKRITDTLQQFKMESLELIFKRKQRGSDQPPQSEGISVFSTAF